MDNESWFTRWLAPVADGTTTMSQRQLSSIDAHGGIDAAVAAARQAGVHLAQFVDDKGVVLIAATPDPVTLLC